MKFLSQVAKLNTVYIFILLGILVGFWYRMWPNSFVEVGDVSFYRAFWSDLQVILFFDRIIDIEVSRLAIGFWKVCIIRLPQCFNFASRIAHLLAAYYSNRNLHKSCKTYQLTNQSVCLLKPTKLLIWLVCT